jgi:hypothetical protein
VRRKFEVKAKRRMRWTLGGATAQRRHRLDMTTTSLSPLYLLSCQTSPQRPLGCREFDIPGGRRERSEGGVEEDG